MVGTQPLNEPTPTEQQREFSVCVHAPAPCVDWSRWSARKISPLHHATNLSGTFTVHKDAQLLEIALNMLYSDMVYKLPKVEYVCPESVSSIDITRLVLVELTTNRRQCS